MWFGFKTQKDNYSYKWCKTLTAFEETNIDKEWKLKENLFESDVKIECAIQTITDDENNVFIADQINLNA